jgi:hypothetical protein
LQPSSEKTLDLFRQEELNYDKQKCREMLLEAAETVLDILASTDYL